MLEPVVSVPGCSPCPTPPRPGSRSAAWPCAAVVGVHRQPAAASQLLQHRRLARAGHARHQHPRHARTVPARPVRDDQAGGSAHGRRRFGPSQRLPRPQPGMAFNRFASGRRGTDRWMSAVRDHRLVTQTSTRLTRRVHHDFPPDLADRVIGQLAGIPETLPLCGQDAERMQASIVITAHGDYETFLAALQLARDDWRDALVGSGLGDDDWPERLTNALGPSGRPQGPPAHSGSSYGG